MDELTLWPCVPMLTCEQCGTQFEQTGRKKRRFCPSCAKDRARASQRRAYAKVRIEVCEECGQEFSLRGKRTGPGRRYLCPACVRDVRRAAMLRAHDAYMQNTRLVVCGWCRVEVEAVSPRARFCSAKCRAAHAAAELRAARPKVECRFCHAMFQVSREHQRFCSKKCCSDFWNAHHNAKRQRVTPPRDIECPACGVVFKASGRRKFCSTTCRTRFAASKVLAADMEDIDDKVVFERDGGKCQICGKKVDPSVKWPEAMSASLDHIQPRSKDGDHVYRNVRLTHLVCNLRKLDGTGPNGDQTLLFGHI